MEKPILGIVAIGLLQIAFVAYNSFDLPIDTSAVSPVREVIQSLPSIDMREDTIVVYRPANSLVKSSDYSKRPAKTSLATIRRSPKTAEQPEPIRPRAVLAVKKSIQPKIRTEYPVAALEFPESTDAYSASVATRRPGKKSFFSKALPIIRKPYDWIKAVAGKFK